MEWNINEVVDACERLSKELKNGSKEKQMLNEIYIFVKKVQKFTRKEQERKVISSSKRNTSQLKRESCGQQLVLSNPSIERATTAGNLESESVKNKGISKDEGHYNKTSREEESKMSCVDTPLHHIQELDAKELSKTESKCNKQEKESLYGAARTVEVTSEEMLNASSECEERNDEITSNRTEIEPAFSFINDKYLSSEEQIVKLSYACEFVIKEVCAIVMSYNSRSRSRLLYAVLEFTAILLNSGLVPNKLEVITLSTEEIYKNFFNSFQDVKNRSTDNKYINKEKGKLLTKLFSPRAIKSSNNISESASPLSPELSNLSKYNATFNTSDNSASIDFITITGRKVKAVNDDDNDKNDVGANKESDAILPPLLKHYTRLTIVDVILSTSETVRRIDSNDKANFVFVAALLASAAPRFSREQYTEVELFRKSSNLLALHGQRLFNVVRELFKIFYWDNVSPFLVEESKTALKQITRALSQFVEEQSSWSPNEPNTINVGKSITLTKKLSGEINNENDANNFESCNNKTSTKFEEQEKEHEHEHNSAHTNELDAISKDSLHQESKNVIIIEGEFKDNNNFDRNRRLSSSDINVNFDINSVNDSNELNDLAEKNSNVETKMSKKKNNSDLPSDRQVFSQNKFNVLQLDEREHDVALIIQFYCEVAHRALANTIIEFEFKDQTERTYEYLKEKNSNREKANDIANKNDKCNQNDDSNNNCKNRNNNTDTTEKEKMFTRRLSEVNFTENSSLKNTIADNAVLLCALNLVLHLCVNAGPVFRNSTKIMQAVQKKIIPTTIRAAMSFDLEIFRLSLNILLTCCISFGPHLVSEIATIFRHVFFRVLSSKYTSLTQKFLVIEAVQRYTEEPQLLIELFLNYDCNTSQQSIYEEMINFLSALATANKAKHDRWRNVDESKDENRQTKNDNRANYNVDSVSRKKQLTREEFGPTPVNVMYDVPDYLRQKSLLVLLLIADANVQWIERFEAIKLNDACASQNKIFESTCIDNRKLSTRTLWSIDKEYRSDEHNQVHDAKTDVVDTMIKNENAGKPGCGKTGINVNESNAVYKRARDYKNALKQFIADFNTKSKTEKVIADLVKSGILLPAESKINEKATGSNVVAECLENFDSERVGDIVEVVDGTVTNNKQNVNKAQTTKLYEKCNDDARDNDKICLHQLHESDDVNNNIQYSSKSSVDGDGSYDTCASTNDHKCHISNLVSSVIDDKPHEQITGIESTNVEQDKQSVKQICDDSKNDLPCQITTENESTETTSLSTALVEEQREQESHNQREEEQLEYCKRRREAYQVASFLKEHEMFLNRNVLGEYFAKSFRNTWSRMIFEEWIKLHNFTNMTLDEALRLFLGGFKLLGEAQIVDKTMEMFAAHYCDQNPSAFASADTAFILSFSICMLNTDAHSVHVKDKMTKEQFIKNNAGIDEGHDVDYSTLSEIYDRVTEREIVLRSWIPYDHDINSLEHNPQYNLARTGKNNTTSLEHGDTNSIRSLTTSVLETIPLLRHLVPLALQLSNKVLLPSDATNARPAGAYDRRHVEMQREEWRTTLRTVLEALQNNAEEKNGSTQSQFINANSVENALPMWDVTVEILCRALIIALDDLFVTSEHYVRPMQGAGGMVVGNANSPANTPARLTYNPVVAYMEDTCSRPFYGNLLKSFDNIIHVCCSFGDVSSVEYLLAEIFKLTLLESTVQVQRHPSPLVSATRAIPRTRLELLAAFLNTFVKYGVSFTCNSWELGYSAISLLDALANGVEGMWRRHCHESSTMRTGNRVIPNQSHVQKPKLQSATEQTESVQTIISPPPSAANTDANSSDNNNTNILNEENDNDDNSKDNIIKNKCEEEEEEEEYSLSPMSPSTMPSEATENTTTALVANTSLPLREEGVQSSPPPGEIKSQENTKNKLTPPSPSTVQTTSLDRKRKLNTLDVWFGNLEEIPDSFDKKTCARRRSILGTLRFISNGTVDLWLDRLFDATQFPVHTQLEMINGLVKVCESEIKVNRTFSLTKLFDLVTTCALISTRLQWRELWANASPVFVTAGKRGDEIAHAVLDGLRIIALTYLTREELLHYSFQKEVIRPFELILMSNHNIEVRSRIVNIIDELINLRAKSLASGWTVVFSALSHAAVIPEIAQDAWNACENIILHHLKHMTDNFNDLIFCLTSFACSAVNEQIPLAAISYLALCGHWLQCGLESPLQLIQHYGTDSVASCALSCLTEEEWELQIANDAKTETARVTWAPTPISVSKPLEKPNFYVKRSGYQLWMSLFEGLIPIALMHSSLRVRFHAISSIWLLVQKFGDKFSLEVQTSLFEVMLKPTLNSLIQHTFDSAENNMSKEEFRAEDYELLVYVSLKGMLVACSYNEPLSRLALNTLLELSNSKKLKTIAAQTNLTQIFVQLFIEITNATVVCDINNDLNNNNSRLYFMERSNNDEKDNNNNNNEFVSIQQMLHALHFVSAFDYERAKLWKEFQAMHTYINKTQVFSSLIQEHDEQSINALQDYVLDCLFNGLYRQLLEVTLEYSNNAQKTLLHIVRQMEYALLGLTYLTLLTASEKSFDIIFSSLFNVSMPITSNMYNASRENCEAHYSNIINDENDANTNITVKAYPAKVCLIIPYIAVLIEFIVVKNNKLYEQMHEEMRRYMITFFEQIRKMYWYSVHSELEECSNCHFPECVKREEEEHQELRQNLERTEVTTGQIEREANKNKERHTINDKKNEKETALYTSSAKDIADHSEELEKHVESDLEGNVCVDQIATTEKEFRTSKRTGLKQFCEVFADGCSALFHDNSELIADTKQNEEMKNAIYCKSLYLMSIVAIRYWLSARYAKSISVLPNATLLSCIPYLPSVFEESTLTKIIEYTWNWLQVAYRSSKNDAALQLITQFLTSSLKEESIL